MKNIRRIFRDAERLQPPPDLWDKVVVDAAPGLSRMQRGSHPGYGLFWGAPAFKLAAALALAAGMLTLGLSLRHRSAETASSMDAGQGPAQYPQAAEAADQVVDPELLVWDADLGELNTDADDAAEDIL